MTFVLFPIWQRSASSPGEFSGLIERTVKRFQTISWQAVGIIFLTGIFNLTNAGLVRGFDFSAAYLHILATKLLLLVVIVGNQSFQSYSLLPKLASAPSSDYKLPARLYSFDRLRKKAMILSVLNLVLAGLAIYLGLGLEHQ